MPPSDRHASTAREPGHAATPNDPVAVPTALAAMAALATVGTVATRGGQRPPIRPPSLATRSRSAAGRHSSP